MQAAVTAAVCLNAGLTENTSRVNLALTEFWGIPQVAGASEDVNEAVSAVHSAVSLVNADAADALYTALSAISAQVARTQRENRALSQAFRSLKARIIMAGLA